jgi:DNA-binding beta-propeller fold protein YncE
MTTSVWSSIMFARLAAAIGCLAMAAPALAAPAYTLTTSTPLGAPDRWDYVVFDAPTQRVYIAHSDRLAVLDAASGALVGQVLGIAGGTHGTGVSATNGQGFTDDGKAGLAVAFDLKTLQILKQIPANADADAIAVDAATGHIFVIEGDPGAITVIDPATDGIVATIKGGEKMEYATSDDHGFVYVAGEEKRDLLKIDAHTNAVVARWPTPDCASPHGLAMDRVGRRLFMGCVNSKMMVVDADSGRVVIELPIGRGSDAIAYDPTRRRVFSPNGVDGTLSIFQQTAPDAYEALDTIPTLVSGRTMAVDPTSGRLFIVAADTDPNPTPGGRPRVRPGTTRVLMLDPVK